MKGKVRRVVTRLSGTPEAFAEARGSARAMTPRVEWWWRWLAEKEMEHFPVFLLPYISIRRWQKRVLATCPELGKTSHSARLEVGWWSFRLVLAFGRSETAPISK